MASIEEIKRLEHVWLVLADLFQDLSQRDIHVDVASDLRNCKALIHFIRTNVLHQPIKDLAAIDESFRNSSEILGRTKHSLVSAALSVNENYAKNWLDKIDKAERAELDHVMVHTPSEFVPSLPRDHEKGWIRLTLTRGMAEERVQEIAEQFGVIVEFQDDVHVVISGRKSMVKRAALDIYDLSLE